MAEDEDVVFEGNTDELMARMEADELIGATHVTPRDFAKMMGVSPQLVYYHIRARHIEKIPCPCCGRQVVEVAAASKYWNEKVKGGDEDGTG